MQKKSAIITALVFLGVGGIALAFAYRQNLTEALTVTDGAGGESSSVGSAFDSISAEPQVDSSTGWTRYKSLRCGISYEIPPGWVSQGWQAQQSIVLLSSPDDLQRDQASLATGTSSESPVSFNINCSEDVDDIFASVGGDVVVDDVVLEHLIESGRFQRLENAQYLKTIDVAGKRAFLYEVGVANAEPGTHYDSILMYVHQRWVEIRVGMGRFVDISDEQREILASLQITK